MGVILAPIQDGKLETWKKWIAEMQGPRKAEFDDLNRRHGLTQHKAWLTETPAGPAVIVLYEGPGADEFMQKLGESDHEFDAWFADKVKEIHGLDMTQPPPGPMPELYLDG